MDEKLSLLTDLIKLAKCDKNLREQEYEFLLTIAKSLDVSVEVFNSLFDTYYDFNPPADEFDRILQFHRLVLLMNIDDETREDELNYVRDIGIRLGLSPLATDKILTQMEDYPNKIIPEDKLIAIFKEQYN